MTVEQYQNDPYAQYLKKVAKVESGGKANAKNPLSSATGLYQFTNDTWKGVVSKYKLGYSLDDRNDPIKSEKVMRLFVKDNDAIIKPVLGREVTDTDRYLTHFLGAGGASSFFKNLQQNGNTPTTSVFSNSVISANKSVMLNKDGSPKTLSDIYGWASKKMGVKVTEESVKNELIDFEIPNKLTNFAYSPTSVNYEDEKETTEVREAKQAIAQEEKEQNFLEDLANNRLESEPLVQEAPEQQMQLPESNILESYGQIDQFVETPIAQQGGILYVDSKNDPRYKAYQDSLSLYNEGEKKYKEKLLFNKKNNIPKSSIRKWNDPVKFDDSFNYAKIQPVEGNGYFYNHAPDFVVGTKIPAKLTDNQGFRYKKPTQRIEVQELQPKVKAVDIQPIQNQPLNIPTQQIDTSRPVQMPTSFDISSQRTNMQGDNSYYNYNKESADYETALRIRKATEAYNNYIQEKYGNVEALKNPKAVERLNTLKQDTIITPQFQQGGKYTENEIALLKELAIKDNKGQYNHPGKITQINSPSITMKGLDKPLIGISLETNEQKVMMPNLDYYFADTKNVLEIPLKK